MRLILCMIPFMFLTGCGGCSRFKANYTGYDIVCISGVSYIQFVSGATVQLNPEGKPVTCGEAK